MSMFTDANQDELSGGVDTLSRGPRLGFMGAMEASYDAGVRASSVYGAQVYAEQEETDNRRRLHNLGLEDVPSIRSTYVNPRSYVPLSMHNPTYDAYDDMLNALNDNDPATQSKIIGDRNDRLKKLKEQYPDAGIKTYDDIFTAVKTKAQAAEFRASLPKTWGGDLGAFIGGTGAQFDPTVNPLNVVTAPIGGVGKTLAMRLGTQGVAQGVVQGINELTGVEGNRRLLGLSHGFGNAIENVAGAVVGGVVAQGAGEALVGAFKGATKWWRGDAPHDPAPFVDIDPDTPKYAFQRPLFEDNHPMSRSRIGLARATDDLNYAMRHMEDWGGAKPWELPPNTDTMRVETNPTPKFDAGDIIGRGGETVDQIARRLDPETFRIYDNLAQKKQSLREQIYGEKGWEHYKGKDIESKLADIDDEIDRLNEKIDNSTRRMSKKYQERIAELQTERQARFEELNAQELPGQQLTRGNLMFLDEKMRDMAPVVSRAYARAQKKWDVYEEQREAIRKQMRNGDELTLHNLPTDKGQDAALPAWDDISRYVPTNARPVDGKVDTGPALDRVHTATDENTKIVDEAVESYRSTVASVLKDEKAETLTINGKELHLNESLKIEDPETGDVRTLTVRQMLEETEQDNLVMKAITTCSISKTS